MLLVQLKSADVACGNATLRTRPSSGQAAFSSRLGYLELSACHSRAAFEGSCCPFENVEPRPCLPVATRLHC